VKDKGRFLRWAAAALVAQSIYIGVSSSPNLFYVANVLVHVFGGAVLAGPLLWAGARFARQALARDRRTGLLASFACLAFGVSLVAAGALVSVGNVRAHAWILHLHVAFASAAAIASLVAFGVHRKRVAATCPQPARDQRTAAFGGATIAALLAIGIPLGFELRGRDGSDRIENPSRPPFDMAGEAMGGATGPFFPSSAETSTGGLVPSTFFMSAETCRRCHADITRMWESSAHRFSSFNNQWYRKSIEYMQEVNSIQSSKWCAGCHDHAVLFNGMFDRPIQEILHTPEAHVGLSCNSCHAIVGVKGTMGQGGFLIEYPPLHDLAASENPFLRSIHDLTVYLDPGPHRRVFLKPFHREQGAEFCSACHKVHLDVPVNNYRWIRGFNEYDNWQASGVSGQGARSFYYPPAPKTCTDCHMPLVPSRDKGNRGGFVHDHSFPAANTALPVAHLREEQLRKTIEFLQAGAVTVDIFAAVPARPVETGRSLQAAPGRVGEPALASTFAVGEEAASPVGRGVAAARSLGPVWAPLDRADLVVGRGEEVRIDVVVRTRNVGHFFPGGTVDAFDVWLELRAVDDKGRTIYWSGIAQDGGRGPVDEEAHFYRSRMLDGHGNPITRRNAWATRSVAYVNLIPPGAADVAHFRLRVPEDCGDAIQLEARLNYRKFSFENTIFSFAGRPAPGEPARPGPGITRVTKDWDDRLFVYDTVPRDVSAKIAEVPLLPIVVMDRKSVRLRVADGPALEANPPPRASPADRERWNDYGIGLLLRGDLAGAERAFLQVVELDPSWPEGYVNVARARLQEGDLAGAEQMLARALERSPHLAKAHYFLGVAYKERGEYDRALEHLRRAADSYPRDRVVRNAIGRTLFLARRYADAVVELRKVLEVDPEDLMAHYNLMLCYRGLGLEREADAEQRLYERFKADEDSQLITGAYRRAHPADNRERQPLHEHPSAPAELIEREVALRRERGEPEVVLPGQAASYARRVLEAGQRALAEGRGAVPPSPPPLVAARATGAGSSRPTP
jgi:tetratricopeptide (TPR) repeat protein